MAGVYEPLDSAIPQKGHVEVDQQPNRRIRQLQVSYQLCFMNRRELPHCLEFNHDEVLDKQVQFERVLDFAPR
jgi:hypothetical protein